MRHIGKSKTSQLQHKADKLLQELIRKLFPKCEVCGQPTQVGHHIVEKSRSSILRYELKNIAHLCNPCHLKIHNIFGNSVLGSYHPLKVIIKNHGGEKWLEKLEKEGKKLVKTNAEWYNYHLERLSTQLSNYGAPKIKTRG